MSVHKYYLKGNKVKYFVKLYYKDYFGKLKPLVKRGFDTKRAAKDYERDYLARHKGNCSMPFSQICEDYLKDCAINGLREGTLMCKRSIIKNLFIPFFADKPINAITQQDIQNWKIYIRDNHPDYANSYLYIINHLLFYIFDYAVNMYDLYRNVARQAKSMGTLQYDERNIWTEAEFKEFLSVLINDEVQKANHIHRKADTESLYIAFHLLFYCGLRISELLEITIDDIKDNTINIHQQYKHKKLLPYVKESASSRTLPISDELQELLNKQIKKHYNPTKNVRLFLDINATNLRRALDSTAAITHLRRLCPHELRHSCCAFYIKKGVKPLTLKKFMGHEKIQTTLDYYGHIYLDDLEEMTKLYNINNI